MQRLKSACLVLVIFVISLASSAICQEFDVRRVNWGMTPEEVRRSETSPPLEIKKEGMVFQTEFLGTPALITYFFSQEKLVAAAYVFNMTSKLKPANEGTADNYLQYFGKIESMLTKKYGEPIPGNDAIWTNVEHKDKPTEVGQALQKGHVKFISDWETPSSEIKLALGGGKDGFTLAAVYRSLKHADIAIEEAKVNEALAMDDL